MAIAEDDEYAELILGETDEDDDAPGSPPLVMWTPEVQYLAAVVDRLGEVIQAVIATAPGGKPPKIKPLPRPRTAFDRARARRARARHENLVAEMEMARARRCG